MYQSSVRRPGQHHSGGINVLVGESNIEMPPCSMA